MPLQTDSSNRLHTYTFQEIRFILKAAKSSLPPQCGLRATLAATYFSRFFVDEFPRATAGISNAE